MPHIDDGSEEDMADAVDALNLADINETPTNVQSMMVTTTKTATDLPRRIRARIFDYLVCLEDSKKTQVKDPAYLPYFSRADLVLFTTDIPVIVEGLQYHNVSALFISEHSKFDRYIAKIDATIRLEDAKRDGKLRRFLVAVDSIPQFIFMARCLAISQQPCFLFTFTLGGPRAKAISVKDQKTILEPFKALCFGQEQKVAFVGNWNKALTAITTTVMTQNIFWGRAMAWEIYNLADIRRKIADEDYCRGNLDQAAFAWSDIVDFSNTCMTLHKALKDLDDDGFRLSLQNLELTMLINFSMTGNLVAFRSNDLQYLSCLNYGQTNLQVRTWATSPHVPKELGAAHMIHRAVTKFGLRKAKSAIECFNDALTLAPDNANIKRCIEIARSTATGLTPSMHMECFGAMVTMMTTKLLQPKLFTSPNEPLYVTADRYLLMKLGYIGHKLFPYPTVAHPKTPAPLRANYPTAKELMAKMTAQEITMADSLARHANPKNKDPVIICPSLKQAQHCSNVSKAPYIPPFDRQGRPRQMSDDGWIVGIFRNNKFSPNSVDVLHMPDKDREWFPLGPGGDLDGIDGMGTLKSGPAPVDGAPNLPAPASRISGRQYNPAMHKWTYGGRK